MQTIKFRAWDTNKKEMRDVTSINWYDGYLWVDETPMTGHKMPIEGTPLMQFTGLLDKNRKEIYKFDLLKGDDGSIKKVFWCDERGQWMIDGKNVPYDELHFHNKHMEVIGNIYENPD